MNAPVSALQPVLDHLPVGAYLCDSAGLITYYNKRAVDLWGRAPALNDPVDRWCGSFRLFHADGSPLRHDQCWMARAIREKRSFIGEQIVIERPDGGRVHGLAHATPLYDDAGRIVAAVNVLVDIGEQRVSEEARAKLAAIVESSHDAIISKTLEGVITSWNRAAEKLFGYAAQETIGQPVTLLIPQDRLREEAMILERLRRGERIDSYETQRRCKDGALLDVSLTISPIRDGNGRIIGASKIARDVSARKLVDRKLRESEQRYRSLVEASGAIVFDADGALGWHARNREWEAYTAQSFDDYRGLGWLEAIEAGDRPNIRALAATAMSRGEAFHTHARLWHAPSGCWRHQELRAVPIRTHGMVQAWVGTWLDIHAQRTAEEAVRASDRRKDEFLAIMAHELRNPLAPLMNSLDLLQAGVAESLRGELVDTASRQAALLVRLVDDLMEASRIGRGAIELRREAVPIADAISDAMEISRPLVDERRQRLLVAMPEKRLQVYGDRARLTQIIANLLNNAAKYTHREGTIEIGASREGSSCVLRVKDNGNGIPRAMLSRIFELFTQVDTSPDRTRGGLGIGLSLVERLVHLHGGTVDAHSEGVGRGSEFVVRLPVLLGQRDAPSQDAAEPQPRRKRRGRRGETRRATLQ
jgi:two-component system, chemotaxis family, CheB/CheR fusion protein